MSHKPKVAKLDGLAKLPHLTVSGVWCSINSEAELCMLAYPYSKQL